MTSLRILLLLVCGLLASACSDHRQQAEKKLRKIGPARIRHEAALLHKDLFFRHGRPDFTEVWYKDWPASFQKFAPIHVGAYIDGFTIAIKTSHEGESGLFVVPESMEHTPRAIGGVSYEKLVDGIYWYSFAESHP